MHNKALNPMRKPQGLVLMLGVKNREQYYGAMGKHCCKVNPEDENKKLDKCSYSAGILKTEKKCIERMNRKTKFW